MYLVYMHVYILYNYKLRKKLVKCYIWSMALYGAETSKLRAADSKYLESFEMWCWRRMEKISRIDHVRNEEVLLRVDEQRNILHELTVSIFGCIPPPPYLLPPKHSELPNT
jgi:hypothetical protein